ncbi:MAG: hypothetical protein HOV83_25195, partial [Catenulispora sp.]|nr:hypothetical protein [Catenulispora sp.]
ILVTLASTMLGLKFLLAAGPVAAVVIVLAVAQWDGVPVLEAVLQRTRFHSGAARGRTTFQSGVAADPEHAWELPGLLAPTQLLSVSSATGTYGVVHHRRLGTLTVTLRCAAQSTWLADPAAAEAWVANWGGWMAGLGHLPMLRWAQVTVDTAPDSGSRLADYVGSRVVSTAPASALRLLRQLVDAAPAAAADVQTLVSLTFDPNLSPAKPKTLADCVEEVDRLLPGLADGLAGCGVTVLGLATSLDLAVLVRAAFDPAARGDLTRATDADLAWQTCGPVAAQEFHDRYVHDSGTSVSWALHEAPRQPVGHDILARLTGPGGHAKRVTLLYRPFTASEAAKAVESQVNAAQFREALRTVRKMDPKARDVADHAQALQAAREEAAGAGLGLVSIAVTVTVLDPEQLPKAVADVESRADMCKIRLRRLWSANGAGFAATLPAGICLPVLARHFPH